MTKPAEPLSVASRARAAVRAPALALVALSLVTACSPSEPKVTVTVGPGSSSSASPSPSSSASPPAVPAHPQPAPSVPAPLGWPRAGWTQQLDGSHAIAYYLPNSWTFDTNESGLWWDGTYHVFCDAYVDHTLNNPGAPNAQTLATMQWNLIGYGPAADQHGFTTFFGYDGWGGNVTLQNGAVEPRAYVVVGDVWINCGAITRNTSATGSELWVIVDSIMIADESIMQKHPWNAGL